jgi:NitT/TauT family transport system permease protein
MILVAVDHHGLGYLLDLGRGNLDVAQVIAVMIVMVVIGMLADRWIFAKLQAAIHRRFGLA